VATSTEQIVYDEAVRAISAQAMDVRALGFGADPARRPRRHAERNNPGRLYRFLAEAIDEKMG